MAQSYSHQTPKSSTNPQISDNPSPSRKVPSPPASLDIHEFELNRGGELNRDFDETSEASYETIRALQQDLLQKLDSEPGAEAEAELSKNTKKANAAFTGLGKTKRIILGDTLLDNYTEDEIETVLAHEFGHYKHKHIIKNLFIGTLSSFVTFFAIASLYEISLTWFEFKEITQVSALPILSVWAMLIGLLTTPIGNIISRKFEYEADEYAIKTTNKSEAFINTLEKLNDQNLGDKEPHPFVEWFFYSHPSVAKRKERILEYLEN